jgi:hypothetical protein
MFLLAKVGSVDDAFVGKGGYIASCSKQHG